MSIFASCYRIDDSFLKIDWDIFVVYSSEFSKRFSFSFSPVSPELGKNRKSTSGGFVSRHDTPALLQGTSANYCDGMVIR